MIEQEDASGSPEPPQWVAPPLWLVWFSSVIVLIGLVTLVAGAIRIGVTVDETFHTVRLQNFLTRDWYLLDDDFASAGPGSWVEDRYVYGPVTALFLHVLNMIAGNEAWASVSTTADAYLVRHLGIALIGSVGIAAAATITRLISGSWRWAIITAAVLASLPMWTGHSMFNVKDVPVGTGYTLFTLACVLGLTTAHHNSRRSILIAVIAWSGFVLAVGTRPAIWPGLAAAGACLALAILTANRQATRDWWRLVAPLAGTILGLITLTLIYPQVFAHPQHWIFASATESASYRGVASQAYLPMAVVLTVPLILLLLGVLGCLTRFSEWVRGRAWTNRHALMALVALQALLLPFLVWVQGVSINGGLRHVLFAAPAAAILITAGAAKVMGDFSGAGRQLIGGTLAAGLVIPTGVVVQLFPYGYGYVNALAIGTASGSASSDYWQASLREYAPKLSPDSFVVCGVRSDASHRPRRNMPNGGQSWLDLSQNCTQDPLGLLGPFMQDDDSTSTVADEFVAFTIRSSEEISGCEEIGRVTRNLLLGEVLLSRGFLCPLMLPAYQESIRLRPSQETAEWLLGGWSGASGDDWITANEPAHFGFNVPPPNTHLQVRLEGTADGAVRFRVNNEPATATATDRGWVLDVPSDRPEIGTPGNVVVTVLPADGEARLTGFSVG